MENSEATQRASHMSRETNGMRTQASHPTEASIEDTLITTAKYRLNRLEGEGIGREGEEGGMGGEEGGMGGEVTIP